ncbi:MAG: hypothetical protein LQ352_000410 [Teloschistes flavicans]|nr:MAG: hypothetical protein LQ352_000410 [Teloschistes flavicans]
MALVNKSSNKKENTRLLATVAFTARLEELLLGPIDILPSLADSLQGHISGVVLIPLAAIANQGQLGVTEQIVERAASYEEKLQRAVQDGTTRDLVSSIRRLSEEYQVLRITSAWRQGRLDLAEILLARLGPDKSVIQPTVAESLADILLEIGRDQAAKHQYTLAVHWLEKAHDVLSSQIPESLSNDADEVRSCILHTMIRILLKERGEKSIPKAWNIVQRLESESENRVAVSLLKLELFNVDPAATQDYYDVLVEVVRQIHLTDTNVKTILHHIHELRRRSTRLTHDVLVLLLTERLLTIGEAAWMEKTLITIIWNFTTSSDLASAPDTLGDLFATMVTTSSLILGTSATHAAQIKPRTAKKTTIEPTFGVVLLCTVSSAGPVQRTWESCKGNLNETIDPLRLVLIAEQEAPSLRSWQVQPSRMPRDQPSDVGTD